MSFQRIRSLEVAGTPFRDAATKATLETLVGTSHIEVTLVPEPTNPHDPQALRVELGNAPRLWVGYWPKATAGLAASVFDGTSHLTATVTKDARGGRVLVLLDSDVAP